MYELRINWGRSSHGIIYTKTLWRVHHQVGLISYPLDVDDELVLSLDVLVVSLVLVLVLDVLVVSLVLVLDVLVLDVLVLVLEVLVVSLVLVLVLDVDSSLELLELLELKLLELLVLDVLVLELLERLVLELLVLDVLVLELLVLELLVLELLVLDVLELLSLELLELLRSMNASSHTAWNISLNLNNAAFIAGSQALTPPPLGINAPFTVSN